MNTHAISESLNFDFLKIEVIDLYNTHLHKEELTLPKKNWSKDELELFKNSILNDGLINNFQNLTYLDLSSLKITDYPDVSNLKKLIKFHHIGGKFTLPISIGECKSIKKIFVSAVVFTTLPKSFMLLENLEVLTIENSNLKVIKNITSLKNIKKLNLRQNKIEKIPDDIINFRNLEYLNLSQNKISDLPNEIYDLKNLIEINLSDNPLFNIIINRINWHFLKILDLSITPFGCFRQNIDDLKRILPNCDIKGGRNKLFYENGDKYFFIPSIKRDLSQNDYIPQ
jgi:Leucine-rich repeat (LRR) protein